MPRFSQVKREQNQLEAWNMSGEGLYNTEIAKKLGVHRHTVRDLIQAERDRRRELLPDEDMKALATYESVLRESWRRLKSHPDDAKAQNVVGYLNAVLGAQNGKNKITGVEAPTRSESDVNLNLNKPDKSLDEYFAQLDSFREDHGEADIREPVDTGEPKAN